MSKQIKKISATNILLAVISALLAFLCIDQKLSTLKSLENQEKLHTLVKRHASYIEMQYLKEEGRRIAFAHHFANANLTQEEIDTKEGSKKLLKMGASGIVAYLSMPNNSTEIITGIKSYVLNSPLHSCIHSLYFLIPSSHGELQEGKARGDTSNTKNKKEGEDGIDK